MSRRSRRILGLALAAVALGGAGAVGAGLVPGDLMARLLPREEAPTQEDSPRPPSAVAQPVRVTPVVFAPLARTATYTGTIRPRFEATLGFRVGGMVAIREVDVGDRVAAGQVLARIDDSDLRLARDAARAEAEAARTDLGRARAEATRARALLADGHVADAVAEQAGSVEAQALGRLDRATAALDLAENQMGYATLTTEWEGVVTSVSAEPGQVVEPGDPVATIARTDALDTEIALPEQLRADLEDATATATLWGEEGSPRALTLREVSPDVDPVSRTYSVRLALTEPDAATALGRTVTVTLSQPQAGHAAVLPLAAVIEDGTGPAIWRLVLDGARVERVPVAIARLSATSAWVTGPLSDGDLVVSLGAHKVDPARPVRVVETSAPPAE